MQSIELESSDSDDRLESRSGRSWRIPALAVSSAALLVGGLLLNSSSVTGSLFHLGGPVGRATKDHIHNADAFISEVEDCGPAPSLDGQALDITIRNSGSGILIVGNPDMRCTQAVISALQAKGMSYTLKEFQTPFQYTPGASKPWDWLHCSYPDDQTGTGTIMHSYVFSKGDFEGNGFAAADKIQQGLLSGPAGGSTCEDRFAEEAEVLRQYQANDKNKVLLFGWLACPCTTKAQTRFAAGSMCYDGRTWANPNSKLMKYLQCKEGQPEDHSFVYFRTSQGKWDFIGNGFLFEDSAMPKERLASLVSSSGASTTCHHANVKVNVFGTPLEECRTDPADMMGSWQDDGTCSEQIGGIHEICIENLPADFSSETHQSPWSESRANQRHCVCVGAWSLYITDAAKHPQSAADIEPRCKAIPETALTVRYLQNWKDWNGYAANVVDGVGKLVERCLSQASGPQLQCGLRARFEALRSKVPELNGQALQALQSRLAKLQCPDHS